MICDTGTIVTSMVKRNKRKKGNELRKKDVATARGETEGWRRLMYRLVYDVRDEDIPWVGGSVIYEMRLCISNHLWQECSGPMALGG